jgi:hypothetical protein
VRRHVLRMGSSSSDIRVDARGTQTERRVNGIIIGVDQVMNRSGCCGFFAKTSSSTAAPRI